MQLLHTGHQVRTPAPVTASHRAVEDDAAAEGLPARFCWAAFGLPFAGGALFVLIFLVARPSFYSLQFEDHAVEWAQFTLLLTATVVSGWAALRFARTGRRGLAVLMVVIALGGLGLTGEEISWGQRVLGLATPAELSRLNQQSELNLHNLNVGIDVDDLAELLEFLIGVVALALALLARTPRGRLRRSWWWWIAPPLFTVPGYLAIAVYRLVMVPIANRIDPLTAFQEYAELTLYFSLACTAVAIWFRSADGRYQTDPRASGPAPQIAARVDPRLLYAILAVAVAITIVFAILSAHSGIRPGNLPGMSRG